MVDRIGEQIGDFVAFRKIVGAEGSHGRKTYWRVKCVRCGKERTLPNARFLRGEKCNCMTRKLECIGCRWYRWLSLSGMACHYCVENGITRARNADGSCASYESRE